MAFVCPHCKQIMHTRNSEYSSDLVKSTWYQCSNLNCGHTAKSHEELVHSIVPPLFPNPSVQLACVKPPDGRPLKAANDDDQFELLLN